MFLVCNVLIAKSLLQKLCFCLYTPLEVAPTEIQHVKTVLFRPKPERRATEQHDVGCIYWVLTPSIRPRPDEPIRGHQAVISLQMRRIFVNSEQQAAAQACCKEGEGCTICDSHHNIYHNTSVHHVLLASHLAKSLCSPHMQRQSCW